MVGTYQFAQRHPGNLGCAACADKYSLRDHPALRGVGHLAAIGDASGPGVAAGTILGYTATWKSGLTSDTRSCDPNGVQSGAQIKELGAQDPRGASGWLSDNWGWLLAGGIGLIAVKEIL